MDNLVYTLNALASYLGAFGAFLSGISALWQVWQAIKKEKGQVSVSEHVLSLIRMPTFLIGIGFILLAMVFFIARPIEPTPTPTSTLSSTDTPIPPSATPTLPPTETPTPTVTPVPGDFEADTEKWGDFPENGQPIPSGGVSRYCDGTLPISNTGECSLEYRPANIMNKNAYVARFADSNDTKTIISIRVYVPSDALCSNRGCSTARIIVWDQEWQSHEGESVELDRPKEWVEIKLDLRGKSYPEPYRVIGVHFYLVTNYQGPLYIDTVTIAK